MKVWIDTELESSILFEVPKENQRIKDNTAENANGSLQPLDTNNEKDDNRNSPNWSHNPLAVIRPFSSNILDVNSTNSQKKKVNFQGVLKYSLVNVDTIGLRRSSRIADMKKK